MTSKIYFDQTLQINNKFNTQSTFGLVGLSILEQDYETAFSLLKTIDERRLTPKLLQHYRILNTYLLSKLGRLKNVPNNFDPVRDYMIYRLFDNSEETLLRHISKHMNQKERNNNGCFFKYIVHNNICYILISHIRHMISITIYFHKFMCFAKQST